MYKLLRSFIFLFFASFVSIVSGELRLAEPFGDHMIIQRGEPITFWGSSLPKEEVVVYFNALEKKVLADGDGNWEIEFPKLQAGGPYIVTVKSRDSEIVVNGVYIGDLWIFSGQSNMQVSFAYFLELDNIGQEYKDCFAETLSSCESDSLVRNYMVATRDENGFVVRNSLENHWFKSESESVKHCNPVGYYFAREVSRKTGVMTAAVRIAWGGRRIERFYKGDKVYEYMLKPWSKMKIKGFAWYQGESNIYKDGDRFAYALKLQLMINGLRDLWQDSNLPVYIVQLPPAKYSAVDWNDKLSLGVFLEAQRQVLDMPYTAMVTTPDLGMSNGLHQPQKYEVAKRLADIALKNVYGFKDVAAEGPQYKGHERKGNKLYVYFETFGSELTTKDGEEARHFEIIEDGKGKSFVPARVNVSGEYVVLWNDDIDKPEHVRFLVNEDDMMDTNLVNKDGVPAATFISNAPSQLHREFLNKK